MEESGKKASAGWEAFRQFTGKLRREKLSETAKRWGAMPEGFRRLVARQAGLNEDRAGLPLDQMTDGERKDMFLANRRIEELSNAAHRILMCGVIPGEG